MAPFRQTHILVADVGANIHGSDEHVLHVLVSPMQCRVAHDGAHADAHNDAHAAPAYLPTQRASRHTLSCCIILHKHREADSASAF
jgi:hypothetical protein